MNGTVTNFAYSDPLWRQNEVWVNGGFAVSTSYNTGSSLPWNIQTTTAIDSSRNETSKVVLDGLGRTAQNQITSDPTGTDSTDTVYDLLGRIYSVSNPHRSSSSPTDGITYYTYDAIRRTTNVTYPDTNSVATTYTNRAAEVTGLFALDRVYQSDGLGRLVSVCDGINANAQANGATASACGQDIAGTGFLTTHGYDALNKLTAVNFSGQNRSSTYDGLSRMTKEVNPESGTTNYSYDAQRLADLYQRTDARSIRATYTHDMMHRLTQYWL